MTEFKCNNGHSDISVAREISDAVDDVELRGIHGSVDRITRILGGRGISAGSRDHAAGALYHLLNSDRKDISESAAEAFLKVLLDDGISWDAKAISAKYVCIAANTMPQNDARYLECVKGNHSFLESVGNARRAAFRVLGSVEFMGSPIARRAIEEARFSGHPAPRQEGRREGASGLLRRE